MQGAEAHSLISVAQLKPVKPEPHTHAYENTPSTHVAAFAHGYDEHSSRSMSHTPPAQPFAHTHDHWNRHAAYVHAPSTHVPPFMHGSDAHSSIVVHVLPPSLVSYPTWHTHSCLPAPTNMHSARSPSQSFDPAGQGSTSAAQMTPDHPEAHVHVYASIMSVHVLPFIHGDEPHSSGLISQL